MKYPFRAFVLFIGIVGIHLAVSFVEWLDFDIGAEAKQKFQSVIKAMLTICYSIAGWLTQIEVNKCK